MNTLSLVDNRVICDVTTYSFATIGGKLTLTHAVVVVYAVSCHEAKSEVSTFQFVFVYFLVSFSCNCKYLTYPVGKHEN